MADWSIAEVGAGTVTPVTAHGTGWRLTTGITPAGRYSNAQISDYGFSSHRPRRRDFSFPWHAADLPADRPVTVTIRARWDTVDDRPPTGTAGFGFWNHPFSPDMRGLPRLPSALWFFYGSPPHDLALAHGVPGSGWKAATIDADRAAVIAYAPLTPLTIPLMHVPALYDRVYPRLQALMHIRETPLPIALLAAPHTYQITWGGGRAVLAVDGAPVLETPFAPRGRLGLCAWQDNQYAILTPQGRIGGGTLPLTAPQTLILETLEITA